MVEQVAGLAFPVDEPALVEVAIDRLQNRDAASSLVHGEQLGRRELKRPRQLARDLSRPRLDQAGRVNALLDGVQVAGLGGDEAVRVSALVRPATSIGSLERKDDPPGTRSPASRPQRRRSGEMNAGLFVLLVDLPPLRGDRSGSCYRAEATSQEGRRPARPSAPSRRFVCKPLRLSLAWCTLGRGRGSPKNGPCLRRAGSLPSQSSGG